MYIWGKFNLLIINNMKRLLTTALLAMCSVSFAQNTNPLWKSSSTKNSNSKSIIKTELPLKHLFDLDANALKSALAAAPKRDFSKTKSNTIISLPNGDGKIENFRVYENSVMDTVLAAKYPEIKSYVAVGIDNPSARAYFSNSPSGFKAMTLYAGEDAVFIEPISANLKIYTAYKKSDKKTIDTFECSTIDQAVKSNQKTKTTSTTYRYAADDGKLRTLRLALACTAEYTAYFGGSKSLTLASMNNTITRISGVFERDFGIKLILVANNDALIYTDPLTDPYSDFTSKSNWGVENQSNLDAVISTSNYDTGHLLGSGTVNVGDAGGIGSVCSNLYKGRGYSCASPKNYQGDAFDISYVAHEMGHQLGAHHTFTYKTEIGTGTQLEPGSGSTIMSYGGLSMKDYQGHKDAYFHAISIQEVTDFIKTKSCPGLIATGNAVPVVNAGMDYSIPKGTPFLLTGSTTDANTEDVLTYSWEEMDLGDATTCVPSATNNTGPLFRSYFPSTSAIRYFPTMTTVLAGLTTTPGLYIPSEVLPGVTRNLNFRLTVRDNRAGGSANNTDDMIVTVDGSSGPFTVDSQNSNASYASGTSQTINWTVAGTNANGVNCASVDILLSTDGGNTFPITLVSATPNTGVATIVIPNISGTTNRIMVKGTNQIFFDVNNANFTITGSGTADTTAPTASNLSASGTTTSSTNLSWTAATDNIGVTGYNVYQNGVLKTTITTTFLAVAGLTASTGYSFYVVAKDAAGNLSVASNTMNVTTLAPADTTAPTTSNLSASGTTTSSTNLAWTAATDNVGVTGYTIYQNGVLKTTTTATTLAVNGLTASTTYNFYVLAKDAAGNSSASSNTVNLTTLAPADTTAPTTSNLSASGTTTSSTNLSWTAATDNVGVTGYTIYQNGVLKTTTTATTLAVTGLTALTTYNFYVLAKDVAGNSSASSNTVNLTTLAPADTTAPTTSTLSASGTTTSSTNLSWTAATDNVGVTGYNVYQNGTLKTTTTATSLALASLTASTTYSFYIVAKDATGNLSAASNILSVNTLSNPKIGAAIYCSSYGTSTAREYINKVQIGSTTNVSGNNNGYGDFTSILTNLTAGTSNTIIITPTWNGAAVNEAYRIWIDFNQDGDFDDSGELVFSKLKTKTTTVSGSLVIPTTALTGATRMRISMKYNALPNPCEIFAYGEVEDYTINISSGATARIINTTNLTSVKGTTNELEVARLSFKLYPNPVREDVIHILDVDSTPSYIIYNLMGVAVAKGILENKSIYVGQLVRGIYILELYDGRITATKRFIKP
jgi:chitodextrinase